MDKTVIELFAGVGGFRVGLNNITTIKKSGNASESNSWNFVFANQWEPSSKIQYAFNCYQERFGKSENHSNENIVNIKPENIPDHNLLVGGFPCQDYSVARGISGEKGIDGEKGNLWFAIVNIIKKKRPAFVLLENVDRLLKSPSTQKGRDFAIILRTLNDNGYSVEWRVINAAEYGFAQKRRRTFIFAFHKSTKYYSKDINNNVRRYIHDNGFFQKQFPVDNIDEFKILETEIGKNKFKSIDELYTSFKFNFENSGIMHNGKIATLKVKPLCNKHIRLKDVLEKKDIDAKFFLNNEQIEKIKKMKDAKKIVRLKPNKEEYIFAEGKIAFPDNLLAPARTMLTSEATINRTSHVIEDIKTKKYRFLTPEEAEKINGFPKNWTNFEMSDRKRYFMMGNALVVGLITKMGITLEEIFENE